MQPTQTLQNQNEILPLEDQPLSDELLQEIPYFETFLHKIGFKRNEGAIYGLLVLSDRPLTSEEIEKSLHISQSAVSQGLKTLYHFGAIETRESRDPEKRVKEHLAKADSLAIVASVFRKREQETIEEFKRMAKRVLDKTPQASSAQQESPRVLRLKSIILTCEMAEAVMNFVISLAGKGKHPLYKDVVHNLPKVLEVMTNQADSLGVMAGQFTGELTKKGGQLLHKKLKESLLKVTGEPYVRKERN